MLDLSIAHCQAVQVPTRLWLSLRCFAGCLGKPRRHPCAAAPGPEGPRQPGQPYARELATPSRRGRHWVISQSRSPASVRHEQYPGQTGVLAASLLQFSRSVSLGPLLLRRPRVASAHLPKEAAIRRRGSARLFPRSHRYRVARVRRLLPDDSLQLVALPSHPRLTTEPLYRTGYPGRRRVLLQPLMVWEGRPTSPKESGSRQRHGPVAIALSRRQRGLETRGYKQVLARGCRYRST